MELQSSSDKRLDIHYKQREQQRTCLSDYLKDDWE